MGAAFGIALAICIVAGLFIQIVAALGLWGVAIVVAIVVLLFYFAFCW